MTLTLSVFKKGSFRCKACKLTFEGEYKPQERPRKSCPGCHKMVGMTPKKKKSRDSSIVADNVTAREGGNGSSPLTKHTKIDDDMIEDLILKKANSGEPISDNFIKTCILFYKDIRGKDDKIKDNVDMEDLKLIATSLEDSG